MDVAQVEVAPPRRPFWRALVPAEWVALTFSLYMVANWVFDPATLRTDGMPRLDLLAALLAVVTARQAWRFRARAWPSPSFARAHWVLFPLAIAPVLLLIPWLASQQQWGTEAGDLFWRAPLRIAWWLRALAGLGTPALLGWLTLGIHVKERGRMEPLLFARESLGGLVRGFRAWAPPLLLIYFYGAMVGILDRGRFPDRDLLLAHVDRLIFFGHDPHQALQLVTRPWLSEWMAFCYVSYALMFPICFGLVYALCDARAFAELATAICFALAVGFSTYTFVPAQGPMFTQHFAVPLDHYYLQWAVDQLLDKYRVPRDCFPSVHTAASLTFLLALRRNLRPAAWALAPVVLCIPLACVYLRYHYVCDVIAGAGLALLANQVGVRWVARWQTSVGEAL